MEQSEDCLKERQQQMTEAIPAKVPEQGLGSHPFRVDSGTQM